MTRLTIHSSRRRFAARLNSGVSCVTELPVSFTPRSTSRLERGHFWAIPLPTGNYGAGCVVGHRIIPGSLKRHSRLFLAGVLGWSGAHPPTAEQLAGCAVYRHGFAHIRTILESGGSVLGKAEINFGSLPSECAGPCDSIKTWGYGVPAIHAASLFATHS